MTTAKFCPQCGTALLPANPLCPRCAFQVAMLEPGSSSLAATRSSADQSGGAFIPPKPEQLAQHFPQLEILDLIGQGGMGAVYKARQRGLNRLVALKILPPEAGRDPAFAERFRREGQALAHLSHPNIVAVYDSNETGGLFYFIMEYVDGVNLRQAIANGQLTPKEALAIVPQICDALQYAHDEGIVHRDIKPENVLIDAKGKVKIADFGLARLLRKGDDSYTLTGVNQVMGTPRYMAPEQFEGSHEVDHRADIYSLGVVFYEMLTGELPLGRFPPPSKKVEVDVRLDEVVLRTLEKEPSLRYQQASDIKTAVQTITGQRVVNHLYPSGREYRSRLHLFGVPLVHVASGIDPQTGSLRVARGIIAVGNRAYGGLAIGGFACGVIAIGGGAIGVVTLGGASLGLLLAVGGGAISTGLALGGLAIAPVAVGGCAVGYLAAGGAGFGVHAIAGNARDPEAAAFFQGAITRGRLLIPFLGLLGFVLPAIVLIVAMVQGMRAIFGSSRPRLPTAAQPSKPPLTAGTAIAIGCLATLLVGFLGLVLLVGASWFYLRAGQRAAIVETERAVAAEMAARAAVRRAEAERRREGWLNWTDDGPALSDSLRNELQLDVEAAEKIDAVLKEVHQSYREVESQHVSRETTTARQTTHVHVPEAEYDQLQQLLWDRLDPLLTAPQQTAARQLLPVASVPREALRPGGRADEVLVPGILGWGTTGVKIDIFRGGEWFEWTVSSGGLEITGTGKGLDPRWKRFWKMPAEREPSPTAPAADEK